MYNALEPCVMIDVLCVLSVVRVMSTSTNVQDWPRHGEPTDHLFTMASLWSLLLMPQVLLLSLPDPREGARWHKYTWLLHRDGEQTITNVHNRYGHKQFSLDEADAGYTVAAALCRDFKLVQHRGFLRFRKQLSIIV